MFGFHIRELQVFRETTGEAEPEKIWRKTKEQGNKWLFAEFTVSIDSHQKVRQTFSDVYKKSCNKLCAFCLFPISFRTVIRTRLSRLCYQRSEDQEGFANDKSGVGENLLKFSLKSQGLNIN